MNKSIKDKIYLLYRTGAKLNAYYVYAYNPTRERIERELLKMQELIDDIYMYLQKDK